MTLTEESKQAMSDCGIPSYMHGAIIRYYENRIEPGSFMSYVINNDLKGALGHADDTNRHCMLNYMKWFFNHAPAGTWGYPKAVSDWINGDKEVVQ